MSEQRERRLVSEWRLERYPSAAHILECNIGPLPEDLADTYGQTKAAKMFNAWRLVVDCVVILQDRLLLVEGKVFRPRDGVGDLLCYRPLVYLTPELVQYKGLPIELVLVIPWTNSMVNTLCEVNGIRMELFSPAWVQDFVVEHGKYWTREYLAKRAERNRIRKALGVE